MVTAKALGVEALGWKAWVVTGDERVCGNVYVTLVRTAFWECSHCGWTRCRHVEAVRKYRFTQRKGGRP